MMPKKAFVLAALWCVLCVPGAPFAATAVKSPAVHPRAHTPLVIAGWIPDWTKASGIPEAMAHLPQLSEVSPFAYEVGENGTLKDSRRLDTSPWAEMLTA